MGRFFSVFRDVPYKGRSYTLIAPLGRKKSLEMKIVTPVASATHNNNVRDLNQQETTNEQNSTTTLEKYISLNYQKDQNRHFCNKNSWRSLKDLLMPGSSCDQYRCPTIKQRLECHQKETHKKCDCIKHRNSDTPPVRRRNSRVSIRSGPDYDQYSDQSLPKECNPDTLTKCRETCQLKSSLVKRNYNLEPKMDENNEDKPTSDLNNFQVNNEKAIKRDVIALKYKDTPTTLQSSTLTNYSNENNEDKPTSDLNNFQVNNEKATKRDVIALKYKDTPTTSQSSKSTNYNNQEEKQTDTEHLKAQFTNTKGVYTDNPKTEPTKTFKATGVDTQISNPKYINTPQFNANRNVIASSTPINTNSETKNEKSENAEASSAQYTNTENLEKEQNFDNKSPTSLERGTSPSNDIINASDQNDSNVSNNRLERKCSKDCQFYKGISIRQSLKNCLQQLTSKVEKPVCNVTKDIKFTRESLIFERPLCADIYTSTYRDSFNNPQDSYLPQPEQLPQMNHDNTNQFNGEKFQDIHSTENKMCACNINEFDAPTNDRHNKYVLPSPLEHSNGIDSKQTVKELYTTTYREAFRQYHDIEKGLVAPTERNRTNHDNKQLRINDELRSNLPSSSKNPDICSCSTSFDFHATADNGGPGKYINDSVPCERPVSFDESTSARTCCHNTYSDSHGGKSNIQRRETCNQYKSNSNQLDNRYSAQISNTNLNRGNRELCCGTTSNSNLIEKEVEKWIHEVPMYAAIEKGAKEYFNEIVQDLIRNLSKISKQMDKSKYEELVKNEINTYLNRIPIWYPGAKRDQEEFKQNIIDRLVQKLNNMTTKEEVATCSYPVTTEVSTSLTYCRTTSINNVATRDDEIRICITEWLGLVYTKSIDVMNPQIPILVELVLKHIEPLLNISVNRYNRKIILKSAIVNTLNELPIVMCFPRSDVQTYNLAKNLTDSLLYIQDKYGRHMNMPRVIKYNNDIAPVPKVVENNSYPVKSVEKVENAINNEIRKCFVEANIDCSNNMLVEETGVILLDCFDVPDPEAKSSAKREITNLLQNTAEVAEDEAKHITNTLMKKTRKILSEGNGRRRSQGIRQRKRCTVLLCTSIQETGAINGYLTYLRNRKSRRRIIKLYSNDFIDKSIQ